MCFSHDYDWYAEISDDVLKIADKDIRCGECPDTIKKGEEYRYIFQQESDGRCIYCDTYEEDECQCDEMGLGETFEHNICLNCQKYLDTIKEIEIARGCKDDETQPAFMDLYHQLYENFKWGNKEYLQKTVEKHPELKDKWICRNIVE